MDPISRRPAMDEGERTLRRIARVGVVLALCWAAGGLYLASVLGADGVVATIIGIVAFAPLYLLYAVAGEVLGARRVRRAMNAMWTWIPPVLHRHVVGSALLLLVVTVAIM